MGSEAHFAREMPLVPRHDLPAASDEMPKVGAVLEGRYRIVGELGSGGVGCVYRAEHVTLGHHVALKVLRPSFVNHEQFRPRFEREARVLASLAHPHVVSWTDFSFSNGTPYLVMELLDGRALREEIAKGPMDPPRARSIVRQILTTLAAMHKRGFVHRDLKPDNVFLLSLPRDPDFVKLLDFGFVKLVGSDLADPEMSQLTVVGMGLGTPSYMSPEQAAGQSTGPASDLYSVGVLLFEMLSGKRPFRGDVAAIVRQQLTVALPELSVNGRTTSPQLRSFLERATGKSTADRFETAEAMLDALDALPEDLLVDSDVIPSRPSKTPRADRPLAKAVAPPLTARIVVAAVACVLTIGSATLARRAFRPPREAARPANRRVVQTATRPALAAPRASAPAATLQARSADAPSLPPFASGATMSQAATRAGRPELAIFAEAERILASGHTLSARTEVEVLEASRALHSDDPRGTLLVAANARLRHLDSRAIALYVAAARIASDAKDDPRMLRDLVQLAGGARHGAEAADAVAEIYGGTALPTIERELAQPGDGSVDRHRLIRLRDRIRGSRASSD